MCGIDTTKNTHKTMIKETNYAPPTVEVLPVQAEGPLCYSGEGNIPNYGLIDPPTSFD